MQQSGSVILQPKSLIIEEDSITHHFSNRTIQSLTNLQQETIHLALTIQE